MKPEKNEARRAEENSRLQTERFEEIEEAGRATVVEGNQHQSVTFALLTIISLPEHYYLTRNLSTYTGPLRRNQAITDGFKPPGRPESV